VVGGMLTSSSFSLLPGGSFGCARGADCSASCSIVDGCATATTPVAACEGGA